MGESIPARRISVHQALGGGAGEPLLSNSLIITRYERDPFIYNHNCLWFWLQMDLIFQMIIFFLLILGILFIGIVADLLLWKIWSGNVTILGMATTMWMLFELAGYNLLSFVANVLFLLVAILFIWAKSATLLNRFSFRTLFHLWMLFNLKFLPLSILLVYFHFPFVCDNSFCKKRVQFKWILAKLCMISFSQFFHSKQENW